MNTRNLVIAAILVVLAWPTAARDTGIADYDIEVALDPQRHTLTGNQTVRWRNSESVPTSELWFHLYLNAFASTASTAAIEAFRASMGGRFDTNDNWGWTRITRLRLADGSDLLPGMTFERPDDGNPGDFTVVRVELPKPVLPGEVVEVELDFEARLPRAVARTGFVGDFHMVAQWFPKLGVFEGESGWNCHQFHASSEFFADFGSYLVRLIVPRGWVVGATGELISRQPVATDDELVFEARDVHDFAWTTAPPDLMTVVETDFEPGRDVLPGWLERAMDRLDVGPAELELPPATIRLLVPRSQEVLAPRMIRATRLAMAWFGLHLGPYPYPGLTVVSPPAGAGAVAGMEYPTFVTTGASRLDALFPAAWSHDIETVTVHEIGHQYFQGLVASNEFERAWLDEGLTSWAENRCLEDMVTDGLMPALVQPGTWARERLVFSLLGQPVTIDRPTWKHRQIWDAFLASYTKTSLVLRTLEGILGEHRLMRGMRVFFEEHRYRHPTGRDFQDSLERSTGEDLEWFFDAVVRGDRTPDWAVLAVRHRRPEPPEGMSWDSGEWRESDDEGSDVADDADRPWEVTVEVGRAGDLQAPVEVELVWSDGRRERRSWDGRARWHRWREESQVRLEQVVVDPDGVWVLETRRADNYWRDEPARPGPLWWLDGVVRFIGFMTVPWA